LKLVGFRLADPSAPPPRDGSAIVDRRIRGYVCTARYSVVLKEPVGLALVEDDISAKGSPLAIYQDGCGGRLTRAVVTETPFYDPEGLRLRM
ncbi:MAG: glycine cleavage T C-terminal barrel domain-containing protein, partial [Desulfobacteraceae bacterium]|nr:glycine cleavage T C-terminal barrel domain-containing protein [Desulfobacteraceae bacterium]